MGYAAKSSLSEYLQEILNASTIRADKKYSVRNRRQILADISLENSAIVDDLIKEAKSLLKAGKEHEADKIIRIAEKLVNNNKRYQTMVGNLLSNAD